MDRDFRDVLYPNWEQKKYVCVGLDSKRSNLPLDPSVNNLRVPQHRFNLDIVEATKDIACAYKPNLAFYKGSDGKDILRETFREGKKLAPHALWELDAKYLDIGNTNEGYIEDAFEFYGADALTIHNYLGREAALPFLACKNKLITVLCRTSNSGAGEFQDLVIAGTNGMRLFEVVARNVATEWNVNGNCALVVGATYPEEIAEVRMLAPDIPFLIPGIGAQGGDLEKTVKAAGGKMIINSSRGIIFASKGMDYAEAAGRETLKLHEAIQACL